MELELPSCRCCRGCFLVYIVFQTLFVGLVLLLHLVFRLEFVILVVAPEPDVVVQLELVLSPNLLVPLVLVHLIRHLGASGPRVGPRDVLYL